MQTGPSVFCVRNKDTDLRGQGPLSGHRPGYHRPGNRVPRTTLVPTRHAGFERRCVPLPSPHTAPRDTTAPFGPTTHHIRPNRAPSGSRHAPSGTIAPLPAPLRPITSAQPPSLHTAPHRSKASSGITPQLSSDPGCCLNQVPGAYAARVEAENREMLPKSFRIG